MVDTHRGVPTRIVLLEYRRREVIVSSVVRNESRAASVEREACVAKDEIRGAGAEKAEAYAEKTLRGRELLQLGRGRNRVHFEGQLGKDGMGSSWGEEESRDGSLGRVGSAFEQRDGNTEVGHYVGTSGAWLNGAILRYIAVCVSFLRMTK